MKCAGREGLKNCFLKNFSLTSQQIKIYTKLIAKISEIFVYLFFHFNHGDHVFLLHELKVLFNDGIHQMSQHLGKRQRQGNSFSDSYGEFTHETKIKSCGILRKIKMFTSANCNKINTRFFTIKNSDTAKKNQVCTIFVSNIKRI